MENIEEINNQIKELQETIATAKKTIVELRKKRFNAIRVNREYESDLKNYVGKEIVSLCFVVDDEFETVMSRYNDGGLLYADHNGRLVYTSEVGGTIRYEDSVKSYVISFNGYSKLLHIAGFFDVEIGE